MRVAKGSSERGGRAVATDAHAAATPVDERAPLMIVIAGLVIGIGLAAVTAFWEALLTPLHATVFGALIRLPIAPIVALVGNVAIFGGGRFVTGRTGLAIVPAVAWFVVIFAAGNRTSEGDLLITGNNWVGVVTILLGAVGWVAGAYYFVFRRPLARSG
jgi:hypothetical protein